MKEAIIGVDAGGTKTNVALIDSFGKVIIERKYGVGSYAVSKDAGKNIRLGIDEVIKENNNEYLIKGIIMGISAFAIFPHVEEYKKDLRDTYHAEVVMINDAMMALYMILEDQYEKGIVAISGTGAAVVGMNNKDIFMTSGWGHLLTERGSGYCCTKDYVIKMIKEYEENNYISNLSKKFFSHFNLKDFRDLDDFIYNHTKTELASFASFFIEKAKQNDNEAISWLKETGASLGKDIINCANHLGIKDNFVLGLIGGYINNALVAKEELVRTLESKGFKFNIYTKKTDPIFGTYFLAKRLGIFNK